MYNPLPELFSKVPNAVETIDKLSFSALLWSKVKAAAVLVFLFGGLYVTLQSMYLKWRGIDEYEHHKSIYKIDPKDTKKKDMSEERNDKNTQTTTRPSSELEDGYPEGVTKDRDRTKTDVEDVEEDGDSYDDSNEAFIEPSARDRKRKEQRNEFGYTDLDEDKTRGRRRRE